MRFLMLLPELPTCHHNVHVLMIEREFLRCAISLRQRPAVLYVILGLFSG